MIEGRSRPRRGGVARLTSRRKSSGSVVRIVGPLIVHSVAAVAVGWKARIVIVNVATCTGNRSVSACERKGRVVVVKGASGPNDGVMARFACGGESQLNMVNRRYGVVVVGLVTRNAGGAGEAVVVVDVTRTAGHRYMCAGQGPAGCGVIECRAQPGYRRMAHRTVRRKCCCRVVWIGRSSIVGLMAIDARHFGQVVVVIDVAGSARYCHVRSGERKSRGAVIKVCLKPRIHSVASLAIGGKAAADVIGVRRTLEIPHVAGITIRR